MRMMLFRAIVISLALSVTWLSVAADDVTEDEEERLEMLMQEAYELSVTYWTNIQNMQDIENLVNQIRDIQKKQNPVFKEKTMAERKKEIEQFMVFSKKHYSVNGVEIAPIEGRGFGLVATKDLSALEVIAKIPFNLTYTKLRSIEAVKRCTGTIPTDKYKYWSYWTKTVYMALNLASEFVKKDNVMRPYLNILPPFHSQVTYFTTDDVKWLTGSTCYEDAILCFEELVAQYVTVYNILKRNEYKRECRNLGLNTSMLTFDMYRWAFTTTATRTYNEGKLTGDTRMAPFWDMANHNNDGHQLDQKPVFLNDERSPKSPGHFYAWVSEDVKKGGEIFLQYKNRHYEMDEFFSTWDMLIPIAPVSVDFKVNPWEPNYSEIKKVLADRKLSTFEVLNVCKYMGNLAVEAAKFHIPLAMATGKKLPEMDETDFRFTVEFIKKRVQMHLDYFPRKIPELERVIEDRSDSLSSTAKQAIRYAIMEQQSLLDSLEVLDKALRARPLDVKGIRAEIKREENAWNARFGENYYDEPEEVIKASKRPPADPSKSKTAQQNSPNTDETQKIKIVPKTKRKPSADTSSQSAPSSRDSDDDSDQSEYDRVLNDEDQAILDQIVREVDENPPENPDELVELNMATGEAKPWHGDEL